MKKIINQLTSRLKSRRAINHHALCNYNNNYYGDQVCTIKTK